MGSDYDLIAVEKGMGGTVESKEAKLAYCANVLKENRSGLIVDVDLRHATSERGGGDGTGDDGTPMPESLASHDPVDKLDPDLFIGGERVW